MPYPASFRGMRNLRLIDVATLNFIRRWVLREQMSIREISRRTGLARNTVKKYLRSDETEPTYVERISPTKLAYAEKLATWLGIEATRSRKQRCYLKRIKTGLLFLMLSERNVDATGRLELQRDRRQPLHFRLLKQRRLPTPIFHYRLTLAVVHHSLHSCWKVESRLHILRNG